MVRAATGPCASVLQSSIVVEDGKVPVRGLSNVDLDEAGAEIEGGLDRACGVLEVIVRRRMDPADAPETVAMLRVHALMHAAVRNEVGLSVGAPGARGVGEPESCGAGQDAGQRNRGAPSHKPSAEHPCKHAAFGCSR